MDETSAHAACERLRANGVDALLDTELLEKEWGGFPARAVHIDADRPEWERVAPRAFGMTLRDTHGP